jgi:dTDP-4-amino-4,6-dideoxygalactose transaminase
MSDSGEGWNINPLKVPKYATAIPVHIAGDLCDMANLVSNGRFVIEDCAHRWPGDGYIRGNIRVFSFYANKLISAGEGGMITTDDPDLYARMRALYYHGQDKPRYKRKNDEYAITVKGYKFNMSDIHASLARVQLAKMNQNKERRETIALRYRKSLGGAFTLNTGEHNHLCLVRCEDRNQREAIITKLNNKKIGYSTLYKPVYYYEAYKDIRGGCFNAEKLAETTISLPIYPGLTESEQSEVIQCFA